MARFHIQIGFLNLEDLANQYDRGELKLIMRRDIDVRWQTGALSDGIRGTCY